MLDILGYRCLTCLEVSSPSRVPIFQCGAGLSGFAPSLAIFGTSARAVTGRPMSGTSRSVLAPEFVP